MTLRLLLVTFAVAMVSCGTDAVSEARKDEVRQTEIPTAEEADPVGTAVVPHNPGDSTIRRELNLAIDSDDDLKDREISFIVSHGDVSVTGTVRSEAERERINHLAFGISGVKSVANALRVSE